MLYKKMKFLALIEYVPLKLTTKMFNKELASPKMCNICGQNIKIGWVNLWRIALH